MMGAAALAVEDARRLSHAVGGPRRVLLLLAIAAVAGLLAATAPALERPDAGVFPVQFGDDAVLRSAVLEDARFRVVPSHGVLRIDGLDAVVLDDVAGPAAYLALDEAVEAWQERQLALEANETAAFPVQVNLVTLSRAELAALLEIAGPSGPGGEASIGDVAPQEDTQSEISPAQIRAPFPMMSLLLAFAYVIPMNFVAQLQAGTFLADRTRRRGLLLLAAPMASWSLVLGRLAVPAGVALLVLAVVTPIVGAGWGGVFAGAVMVALPLTLAAVLGLVARNERDLTFLLTGTTTLYSVFLFLPAVFSAVPEVAYLSPVTVVAASIEGIDVPLARYALATVPLLLATLAFLALAIGLAREEAMFTPSSLTRKIVQGLAGIVRTRLRLAVAGVLMVPFAFALELLVLALAVPLSLEVLFPIALVAVALVEEGLKAALA